MAGLFDFITSKDPDSVERRLRLAQGLGGMTTNPNVGLQNSIQSRLSGLQDQRKATSASDKLAKQSSMVASMLGGKFPMLVQAMEGGLLTPNEVLMESRKPPAERKTTEMERAYERSVGDGSFTGTYLDFIKAFKGAGATKVNVTGDSTLPAKPEAGTQIIEKDGVFTQAPISGGSVDIATQKSVSTAEQTLDVINNTLNHPGLGAAVGPYDARTPTVLPDAIAFEAFHNQIKGSAFLAAFEALKGGGQITEVEGMKAEQAMSRLDLAQDEEDYKRALNDLKSIISNSLQRSKDILSSIPTGGQQSNADPLGLR
tara:strand:+ start:274 stop:1215 length:942 start_codon:yes stop_codon:yes gene_type:complete